MRVTGRPARAVVLPTLAALGLGLGVVTAPAHANPPHVAVGQGTTGVAGATTATVVRDASARYAVTWPGRGRHWVSVSTRADAPPADWREVGSSTNGSLTVADLRPDRRWYFRIDPDRSGRHGTVLSTRALDLDTSRNTRDLGGYPTADGRSVAWGNLFRTEAITQPTTRDTAVLEGLGLVRSLEFRSAGEVASKGHNRYPAGIRETWAPLLDPSTDALSLAIQAALGGGDPAAVEELLGGGKAWQIALTGPTKMSRSPVARAAFGSALRQLADEGNVIFNCTAGKDRTGVFAAVLLRTLGVRESTVVEDYVLSNVYRHDYNQATYRVLANAGVDVSLIQPLMEQQAEAIHAMFEAIDQEYGSFEAWLDEALGVDAETVAQLRATLLV